MVAASSVRSARRAAEPAGARARRPARIVAAPADLAVQRTPEGVPRMRILLVEDPNDEAENRTKDLVAALTRHGATTVRLPEEHLDQAALAASDLVLLDLGAGCSDGTALCRQIRAASDVPLIILADPDIGTNRTLGLRSGADDFLNKPYDLDELIALIQAILRRRVGSFSPTSRSAMIGDVFIDMGSMSVTVGGTRVDLTKKEFQMLALFAEAEGHVCPRERLAAEVWGRPAGEVYETMHVLISRLRTKLGPGRIRTVRSLGYQLVTPDEQK
jgi:DNA-binding response OmpR family regulator